VIREEADGVRFTVAPYAVFDDAYAGEDGSSPEEILSTSRGLVFVERRRYPQHRSLWVLP